MSNDKDLVEKYSNLINEIAHLWKNLEGETHHLKHNMPTDVLNTIKTVTTEDISIDDALKMLKNDFSTTE